MYVQEIRRTSEYTGNEIFSIPEMPVLAARFRFISFAFRLRLVRAGYFTDILQNEKILLILHLISVYTEKRKIY